MYLKEERLALAFCFRDVGLWSLLSLLSTVAYGPEHHEAGHREATEEESGSPHGGRRQRGGGSIRGTHVPSRHALVTHFLQHSPFSYELVNRWSKG